ncbi:ROK family protein [Microbacterium invictum]|uniref:NBD/HSP70 family sugar kinase n=1 Tax=Microbacterium invictum TaxID=515415 RepID=A0AA40SPB4_9MICO|nr:MULTISPECIES: ROK family protein [Microbacterium]MBB4139883.1 putative NBD/HSP70 family sugar kinase [Microbacterium invictum]
MRFGLDVGGTKTDAVAVAPDGMIVGRVRRTTGWGPDAVVATIADSVRELAEVTGVRPDDVTSIGIGIPGQVAEGTATVHHAVNLGVERLDLSAALGPVFGVPVRAENDVKAAAVGGYAMHGGTGTVAYLNLGTGIAAGLVRDGRIWRGVHGTAGEVGHISVDPHGPLCPCGQHGCIEAFSGGGSLARRWGRSTALPVRDVFDAADAGDAEAIALRAGFAYGVASAIRVLVLTVDVDAVVLGGGITALADRVLTPVVTELERSAAASAFMRSLRLGDRVQLLPPGSPAAALGAALIGDADPVEEREPLAHG